MRRVLILGGTGAMGKHLSSELCLRGLKVTVTTRKVKKGMENLEFVTGNAMDTHFLDRILVEKWDAIVDFMNYKTPQFKFILPKLLAATSQYVYISSARVYAESEDRMGENHARLLDQSEDLEFLSTDEYCLAKARQEDCLVRSGLSNWTVVRPYITYSEERLQLGPLEKEAWLYRASKGRSIVFSREMLPKLTTMTYGLDVAVAIADLIGEPGALGETFHVTSDEFLSWSDVLRVYLDALEESFGARPKVILLDLQDFMKCRPATYQIKYDRMFNRKFDNLKISRFSNMQSTTQAEEGLKICLNKFFECPQFDFVDWRLEAIKDRYAGEVASISEMGSLKNMAKYYLYRFFRRVEF